MAIDFSSQRLSYEKSHLLDDDLPNHPYVLLDTWIQKAQTVCQEAYAFYLATTDLSGNPSARTLLMRQIYEDDGNIYCVFYSNYKSLKGQNLAQNPKACALFFWPQLEQQVRIMGSVTRLDAEKSHAYFKSRPIESQIAAHVSNVQSAPTTTRADMMAKKQALQAQFGQNIPCPKYWGGYVLLANSIEFWQGGAARLHDRILYQKDGINWQRTRLLP